jgi:poly-gamma-glutamate synthesis protein (capsule biosynthesis protein)
MIEDTITIYAVGDIFLGEHPVTLNHGVNSMVKRKGCDFLFSKVKGHLEGADIVCGNLEGIISPKKANETGIKSAIYWGEPQCAEALRAVGFNCLFLSNNHNAQHGRDALERTCHLLDQMEIKWTGFNPGDPSSPIPAIFEIRGLRLAFLSYCETQQYNLETPILPIAKVENIEKDVARLKGDCDFIVISLHWGDEFINYPSPIQIRKAHDIVDMGARVILGHHSHVAQGIENYGGGLIAYSLGSFTKDLWSKRLRESVLLKVQISKNQVKKYELVPIFINNEYQPEIYQGPESLSYLQRIENLSKTIKYYHKGNFKNQEKKYHRDVKRLLIIDRIKTIIHYVLNFFRYDKDLLWENMLLIIKRRIWRRNI